MNTAGLILVGISGVCRTIVYVELIRNGFRDKACGMPLFALGLNIAWEFLYSIDGLFIPQEFIQIQNAADMVWALCDVAILVCWFRYGKQYLPDNAKKYFIPYSILALVVCIGMCSFVNDVRLRFKRKSSRIGIIDFADGRRAKPDWSQRNRAPSSSCRF